MDKKRKKQMTYDIVAVGNPVYDIIITPYLSTKKRVLSGCSTNACLAAKKLGTRRAALVGYIGKDFEGAFIEDAERYGVEIPRLMKSEETGGFKLVYDKKGDRTLDVLGIADKITVESFPKECLDAKAIVLGPILQEVDFDLISFLRKESSAILFLDPQGITRIVGDGGRIERTCDPDEIKKIVDLVDFVKPNEHESLVMTGIENPEESARKLVKWGADVGIVTLAERGSVIYDGKKIIRIPAYKTIARDPTGAGDTYAGSFVFEYLRTGDVFQSGYFGSAAASIMVEYTGPGFPMTLEEVEKRKETLLRQ
ncbi:MAG: carbohydrate kinase family protein [Promethearchaeota archaeon]